MMSKWLVVGISGATCSGKTTLSQSLLAELQKPNNNMLSPNVTLNEVKILNQDDYFLQVDDPRHTIIPNLGHLNWELLSALDMKKMSDDIQAIIRKSCIQTQNTNNYESAFQSNHIQLNILIIEGFLIYNHPFTYEICDIKLHLNLDYSVCFERRRNRVYDPPDVPGYFEQIVWPHYLKNFEEFRKNNKIKILDGSCSKENILCSALTNIKHFKVI